MDGAGDDDTFSVPKRKPSEHKTLNQRWLRNLSNIKSTLAERLVCAGQ